MSPPPSDLWLHLSDSLYYALSLTLAYLLMLVFMTYHVGMCLLVVGGCFLAHFGFNYAYHTRWRRSYQRRVRRRVQSWSEQMPGAGLNAAADERAVVLNTDSKPTTGDHCCDDLDFDDI